VILAAILAGGDARRMGGGQKALLEVGGRAILDHQLEVLRPRAAAIAAVLADSAGPEQAAPFAGRGLEILRDRLGGRGPLAGLAAALAWAGTRGPHMSLLVLGCDMPHVAGALIDHVVARARVAGAELAVPVVGGRPEPLLACYSALCRPLVEEELAGGRLRLGALPAAARAAGLRVVEIDEAELRVLDPELLSFTNVNRPSDRI
jgi:molybdenum cofactor guanylyltransferase